MTAGADLAGSSARVMLIQTQAEAAGAQEISRLLARELLARGYDVRQVFLFRRTAAFDHDPRAAFCASDRPSGPVAAARMLWRLFREIRRFRPETVITFQHYGNLVGGAVARAAGVRRLIANQNGMRELLSGPVIALDRALGARGLFSRIVVNSEETEAEYSAYPASYRARLVRIDHGFEPKRSALSRTEARSSFSLPPDGPLLGCVARLAPAKHIDAAIGMLPAQPGWRLAVAGQGPARAELESLAESLDCADRLHLLGELPPPRIADLLAALDVFVFPSTTETFGLAAVEAAGAGVPVIANDLPVLREVLAHDGEPCAIFVDVNDTHSFAAAVEEILANPELAAGLSKAGRRIGDRFPLAAMVDGYEALIRGRTLGRG